LKYDEAKFRRLSLDHEEGMAAIQATARIYDDARDRHGLMRTQLAQDTRRDLGDVWTDRNEVSALLDLDPELLKNARVNLSMVHAAIAERERMHELARRMEQARADLAPLAALVASMREYVNGKVVLL
jgi:hypothetical protein